MLEGSLALWWWHVIDCSSFSWICFKTFISKDRSHKVNFFEPKLALFCIKSEFYLSGMLQRFLQLFNSFSSQQDVIHNHCTWISRMFHGSLEDLWCSIDTKGHSQELESAERCCKGTVVRKDKAWFSLICQKELFVSWTEKTVAPDIWAATSFTVHKGWWGRINALFKSLKSIWIRISSVSFFVCGNHVGHPFCGLLHWFNYS